MAILATFDQDKIPFNLYVEVGTKAKKRILSIKKIAESIGSNMSNALPALHAMTGCDSTSAFYGIGKKKAYKIVKDSPRFLEVLAQLGNSYTPSIAVSF